MTEEEEFRLLWEAHLRALPEAEGRGIEPLTPEERSMVERLSRGELRGAELEDATRLVDGHAAAMELLAARLNALTKGNPVPKDIP